MAAGTAVLCITVGTGCREKTEEQPVEITLMHGFGGTLESYEMMQEIYDEFSEQNPDIKLKSIAYMNYQAAAEKANDMLAVGEMPDILSTNSLSYFVDNAVKTGMALDLMPYIEADPEWKEQIHSSVFETWEDSQGHLYTIPDALELIGYWYNADYIKEAGIVDEAGNPDMPETWEEFMEMTERLQEWTKGTDISVFSLETDQVTEFLFPARLAGDGPAGLASVQDPEDGISRTALEHTVSDLETLNSCSQGVDNIESARQRFSEGKTVIYFNGVWEAEALEESRNSDSFSYADYPTVDGQSLSYVSPPSGYVLAKQTDQKKEEACIRFLKYMLSDEVQERIAVETGQVPCNPKVSESTVVRDGTLFGEAVKTVQEADIQIKSLTSVWDTGKRDILSGYLMAGLSYPQKMEEMIEKLETDRES